MDSRNEIRILHVFGRLDTGGAETFIMNIYRNIDRKKVQFDFVVHGNHVGFYEREINELGGRIYRVPVYKGSNHVKYKCAWNSFFRNHPEHKIVHSHVRSTASIILKIAKNHGIKTICHSHSTSNGSGLSAFVKKIYQKSIVKYADYLFSCSIESAKWLYGDKYAESNRCFIINNAIDTKRFIYSDNIRIKIRNNFGLEDRIVLGQVGRFTEAKNYSFTIDLLKKLVKKNEKYCLFMVGSGPLKEKIVEQIDNYNLNNNCIILENRADVNELLQAMDVFLMPSLWEGLPLALIEAQTASLPCIISENVMDGIIINDKVIKLNLNSNEEWVKKIENIVNKKYVRKNEAQKIIDSGFDIVENASFLSNFYIDLSKSGDG